MLHASNGFFACCLGFPECDRSRMMMNVLRPVATGFSSSCCYLAVRLAFWLRSCSYDPLFVSLRCIVVYG